MYTSPINQTNALEQSKRSTQNEKNCTKKRNMENTDLTEEQNLALGKMLDHTGPFFLAGNLGSGKTRVALELFHSKFERMVVLFPNNSLRQTWKQELEKWFPQCTASDVPSTAGNVCLGTFRMLLGMHRKHGNLNKFAKAVNHPSTLIVIDESHTMRLGVHKETLDEKPTFNALKSFMHACSKAQTVFMSATHMIETTFDYAPLEWCINPSIDLKQWQSYSKRKKRPPTASPIIKMKGKDVAPMEVVVVEHDPTPEETTLCSLWEKEHIKLKAAMQGSRGTNYFASSKAAFYASMTRGKRGAQHPKLYGREFVNSNPTSTASSKFEALTRLFKARSLHSKFVVIMGEFYEPLVLLEEYLKDKSSFDVGGIHHGGNTMKKNASLIDGFNNGAFKVLLATRGSSGVGCNMTGPKRTPCTTVVFLDSVRLPRIEDQHRGRIQRPLSQENADKWTAFYLVHSRKNIAEKYGSKWICKKRSSEAVRNQHNEECDYCCNHWKWHCKSCGNKICVEHEDQCLKECCNPRPQPKRLKIRHCVL